MMSISIRFPPLLSLLAALGTPVCVTADSIPTPVRTFAQAFAGGAGQGAVRATAVPDLYEVRLGDQFQLRHSTEAIEHVALQPSHPACTVDRGGGDDRRGDTSTPDGVSECGGRRPS